jgi:hypothetical protein
MMESVDGNSSGNLQEVWRWLKCKMEQYQKLRLQVKKVEALAQDRELIRVEEILKILNLEDK